MPLLLRFVFIKRLRHTTDKIHPLLKKVAYPLPERKKNHRVSYNLLQRKRSACTPVASRPQRYIHDRRRRRQALPREPSVSASGSNKDRWGLIKRFRRPIEGDEGVMVAREKKKGKAARGN